MNVELADLKTLLIENCMLRLGPDEIAADTPLFSPEGLGLDSIDALQLAVAVEKTYGVAIKDSSVAREALQSLATLREWITRQNDGND